MLLRASRAAVGASGVLVTPVGTICKEERSHRRSSSHRIDSATIHYSELIFTPYCSASVTTDWMPELA